jgi:hypothetical protein
MFEKVCFKNIRIGDGVAIDIKEETVTLSFKAGPNYEAMK